MNVEKYIYILLIITSLSRCQGVKNQDKLNDMVIENAVIAHRGMPNNAPEETAPSYWLAKKLGADYLEADLQRTKDGVIICLHDNNLKRTTNIEAIYPQRANDPVSMFTLDELKQLDAGSWFNKVNPEVARPSYNGLPIITLHELIDIAEADNQLIGLYLETKNPELFPNIEKDLFDLLNSRGWVNNPDKKLILQTFSIESLKNLNKYFSNTPKCMLLWNDEEFLIGGITPEKLQKALSYGKVYGATIVGPSFNGEQNNYFELMDDWMIELYQKNNYLIHPYTFNTTSDLKYVTLSNGQFTNRSDLLLDYLKRDHKSIDEILTELNY